MQAIITKYHGPAGLQGSRMSATCDAGRRMLPRDHALDSEGNHRAAAEALARKLGWLKPGFCLVGGAFDNGRRMAWLVVREGGAPCST